MRRRRSRVSVRVDPNILEPREQPLHEIAAAMAALRPPSTSAHDTDQETPCCVCGGACEPRTPLWGPWRRHQACEAVQGDPVRRLVAAGRALGREIEVTDAALVPFTALPYSADHPEPVWTDEPTRLRLPWRHVDRAALFTAIDRLPELRAAAGLDPNTCTDGNCGWCGVREGRGWASYGHTWADGTQAPLCGGCGQVYERNGSVDPHWWDGQRPGIAEAARTRRP